MHTVRNWKRHQTSQHLVRISSDHSDGSRRSHASRSLKSLCVLVWHGAGINEHRAAWRATWCSGGEAFALKEFFLEMATARGGRWPARAAHVAVQASTGRRR